MSGTVDLNELIQTTVMAQIVSVLNTTPNALEQLVKSAIIDYKVNKDGYKDQYSSHNTHSYLEATVGRSIREMTDKVIREVIAEREADFKEIIHDKLTGEAIVDGMIEKLLGGLSQDWRINVKFIDEDKKY